MKKKISKLEWSGAGGILRETLRETCLTRWIFLFGILFLLFSSPMESFAQPAPLKIGLLTSETGQFAWYGDDNIKGARFVEEDINRVGGISGRLLQIVILNTESNPEKAVLGAKRLIDHERVAAICGLGLISEAKAVAPLVRNSGPVTYSLSGAYYPEHRYMFAATVFLDAMIGQVVKHIKDKGMTKLAALFTNDATGQMTEPIVRSITAREGVQIVATEYMNLPDVDVTPQLSRIRGQNPQAVVAWVVGRPINVIVQNYRQLAFTQPLFTSHGNLTPLFLKSISEVAGNISILIPSTKDLVWQSLPADDPQKAPLSQFGQRFVKAHGRDPGLGVGSAYDAITILAKAIGAVGADSDKIVNYIEGIKGHIGVSGIYNFSPSDHRGLGMKDVTMVEVKEGKLIPAK